MIYYGKTMVLWKKKWYYRKTLLWCYAKTYGTIPKTMKLRFTKEKDMVDYQKQRNFNF